MKAKDLVKKLLENPEVDVMFTDPNSDGGPFSVGQVSLRIAEEDEFPEEFNMKKVYKFIELTN